MPGGVGGEGPGSPVLPYPDCQGGPWAYPVNPDYSVSDDDGWARRSQQTPSGSGSREGPNFWVRGDRPDNSAGVEPREGMTDQLSLFGGEGRGAPPWEGRGRKRT